MKNAILLLTAILFIGCGARKSNVSKSETEKTVKEQSEKTTSEVIKETETVTTEGEVIIPEHKTEIQKPISVILEGEPMIYEDEHIKSETSYDKETGNIKNTTTQKPKTVPVKTVSVMDREITRGIEEKKTTDTAEKSKLKDKVTEKEDVGLFTYIGIGAAVLFMLWLIIFFIRKANEKKNIV